MPLLALARHAARLRVKPALAAPLAASKLSKGVVIKSGRSRLLLAIFHCRMLIYQRTRSGMTPQSAFEIFLTPITEETKMLFLRDCSSRWLLTFALSLVALLTLASGAKAQDTVTGAFEGRITN